ncbi:hypothetical protein EVC45_26555 [Paraburkholderia sp. UYCP14C]|uniref:hypothetical protein n=1 Tax=Paraburkholderia sp. UYCP14C TaxID=2511130 RepID=UPI00102048F6|nr:hypothetical protein [Paraburkholderia sp. UYCP14C]RZF26737.1 hypothetical protein EVC45_26555 [Paraburkholderia sp. UYCP14C]
MDNLDQQALRKACDRLAHAVSIAAELIATKNGVPPSALLDVRAAKNDLELEPDALRYCAAA